MPSRRRRNSRGFTLVEAIASMTILAAIASVSAPLILAAGDGYADAATSAQLHLDASVALDRLARELRSIEQDPASSAPAPRITSVTASSIAWNTGSSATLSGTQVVLTIDAGPPAVLLGNAAAFEVGTFDESGTPLAKTLSGSACQAVRRIELTLTLARYGVSHSLRTRVFTRAALRGGGGG